MQVSGTSGDSRGIASDAAGAATEAIPREDVFLFWPDSPYGFQRFVIENRPKKARRVSDLIDRRFSRGLKTMKTV
jgi:hypothetical protein